MISTQHATTLTKRQSDVLDVIRDHIEKTGAPPTRAEIAKTLGFKSVNAAEDHLKALARKGVITLIPGTSRGIHLSAKYAMGLPVIQSCQSTQPVFSPEHYERRLRIQTDVFSPKPDYLYVMPTIALLDIGIKAGDLLAIHCTQEAQFGQWVLARYQEKIEIRRYLLENNQIILKAAHPNFPKIMIDLPSECQIEGIVVGLIRTSGI